MQAVPVFSINLWNRTEALPAGYYTVVQPDIRPDTGYPVSRMTQLSSRVFQQIKHCLYIDGVDWTVLLPVCCLSPPGSRRRRTGQWWTCPWFQQTKIWAVSLSCREGDPRFFYLERKKIFKKFIMYILQ